MKHVDILQIFTLLLCVRTSDKYTSLQQQRVHLSYIGDRNVSYNLIIIACASHMKLQFATSVPLQMKLKRRYSRMRMFGSSL